MRILQVSSARELGGGETHVLQLVAALRELGHDVVVAGRPAGPLKPDIAFSALRMRSLLKREPCDILHAHVARDYPIAAAAALGIRGVKVVFTRHLLYPVRRNPLYRRVNGWIAPTEQILKTLQPLQPKTAAVIPNWVDVERFAYRPHAFHQPVRVALIGQVSPHKGHDDAIEAIRRTGADAGYRLMIAGSGDRAYLELLRRKAAGLPVEFTGFVRLPEYFDEVDILIVPSWEEPFGIVILEAMAAGIPVIATDRGGPREILPGVLIPPHDPAALAQAIQSLHPGEMVQKARMRVESSFDIRKVVPRIEEFYAAL